MQAFVIFIAATYLFLEALHWIFGALGKACMNAVTTQSFGSECLQFSALVKQAWIPKLVALVGTWETFKPLRNLIVKALNVRRLEKMSPSN